MKLKGKGADETGKDNIPASEDIKDSEESTKTDEAAKDTENATNDPTNEETDKTTASDTEKSEVLTLADFETDKETGFLKLKLKDTTNNEDEDKGDSDKEKDFIDDMISAFGTDEKEGETKSEDESDDVFKGFDLSPEDLAEAITSAVKSEVATLTGKLD